MSPATAVWLLSALATVPSEDKVRASINRALALLLKAAEGHVAKPPCFACHNQALPVLAFHAARERGFTVDDADLKQQTDFIAEFLGKNKEKFRQGTGTGGQVDSAGYALLTLELGGHKPDGTTPARVEDLLKHQAHPPHHPGTANPPPPEANHLPPHTPAPPGLR